MVGSLSLLVPTFNCTRVEKDQPVQVKKSIFVKEVLTWTVYYDTKQLASSSSLLKDVHSTVDSSEALLYLSRLIDTAALCPGNPEAHFVTLCTERGGSERGCGEDKAFVEHKSVLDTDGQVYTYTVRTVDCEWLCSRRGANPTRCSKCQIFRPP